MIWKMPERQDGGRLKQWGDPETAGSSGETLGWVYLFHYNKSCVHCRLDLHALRVSLGVLGSQT